MNMNSKIVALALLSCLVAAEPVTSDGGIGPEEPSTPKIEKMVNHVKKAWQGEDDSIVKLKPISYREQWTAGLMYYIKARATHADNSVTFVHLKIVEHLNDKGFEFFGMRHNLTECEPLEYFDES